MDNSVNEKIETNNTSHHKRVYLLVGIPLAVLLAVIVGLILYCVFPHTCEVGGDVQLRTEAVPFSYICETVTELNSIDTSKLGNQSIKLKFFGFLKLPSSLEVKDTTSPTLALRNLIVPKNLSPFPEDFVLKADDLTAMTFAFTTTPDTSSNGTVTVSACDEGGNTATSKASFTLTDDIGIFDIELGTTKDDVLMLLENTLNTEISSLAYNKHTSGTTHAIAETADGFQLIALNFTDTKAPDFTVVSHDILFGQTLSIGDFVTEVTDASEYTAEYITRPNFEKTGHQDIEIRLKDEHGNEAVAKAGLNIHKLDKTIVIEAGTTAKSLGDIITNLLGTDDPMPRITESFEPEHLTLGTHETELIGEYSVIPINIIIEDTTPPKITLCRLTVFAGSTLNVTDFITSCEDESSVQFRFKDELSTDKAGNFLVTVVATDSAGNSAECSTVLKVTRDDVPPTIYGVCDITAFEGDTISYKSGVYAIDDKDGKVSVKVDSSSVNTSVPGTYFITYSASDSDKNTSTATATLTINPITIGVSYTLADEILSEITTEDMSDTEKARAVYDWCRANIKYSTLTSRLMGYYAKAAYSGFTKHYGNCYTYYAVASVLLTRAGITNIQIQRNSTSNPHYWNLVKIGDSWYHFDTCPQPPPHNLEVFLLTDSEVREFSKNKVADYYNFDGNNYPATP